MAAKSNTEKRTDADREKDRLRQRKCRRVRKPQGIAVLNVEVRLKELGGAFVERGWLAPGEEEDRAAVAEQVSSLVDCWILRALTTDKME